MAGKLVLLLLAVLVFGMVWRLTAFLVRLALAALLLCLAWQFFWPAVRAWVKT